CGNSRTEQMVLQQLAVSGFQTLTARDTAQAVSAAIQQHPNLLITDESFSEEKGLELCRHIRGSDEIGFIYIIVLIEGDDRGRALEAGADDALLVSCVASELVARLRAGMRIGCLEEGLAKQNRANMIVNTELRLANQML